MRREFDTSAAKCDTCGKLYQAGDAVYSVADKFDESVSDRDVLISFRHWNCHTPIEKSVDVLRAKLDDAQAMLDKLRKLGL